jgi:hypothetical protein
MYTIRRTIRQNVKEMNGLKNALSCFLYYSPFQSHPVLLPSVGESADRPLPNLGQNAVKKCSAQQHDVRLSR